MGHFRHIAGYDLELESVTTEFGRVYVVNGEAAYPSVTTVLGSFGNPALDAWRARVGEEEAKRQTEHGARRGSEVHDAIEQMLLNKEVNVDDLTEVSRKIFNSMRGKLMQINDIVCLENCLYSHKLKIAGRVDCIAIYNGVLAIIDFKTSTRPKARHMIDNYELQVAAYAIMFEEMYGIEINDAVIMIGVEKNIPQLFTLRDLTKRKAELIEKVELFYERF